MSNDNKKIQLKYLLEERRVEEFYRILESTGDLKSNYSDYLITGLINCDEELERVDSADYELCAALLTMLLREDHFCNGTFV